MKKILLALTIGLLLIGVNVFAADGDLIVNGNVGIGTTTPAMKLDVNGGVRIGSVSMACSAAIEGAQRYNSSAKTMEFCNGTYWMTFGATPPPPDEYTKLLLHFDGSGNTFIDSSSSNKTITAYGYVTQSSTQSKFGGKSAYFDGTGDYLSLADSDDWNLGSGDFTIDLWTMFSIANSQHAYFAGQAEVGVGYWVAQLYYGYLGWGANGTNLNCGAWAPAAGIWYHLAWVVTGGTTLKCYANGQQIGSQITIPQVTNFSGLLEIGTMYNGNYVNGYIDEFRISKGIARWTSNFTPPTAPY